MAAARELDRAATALSRAIVSDPGAVDSARTALYRAQDAFRDALRAAFERPAAPAFDPKYDTVAADPVRDAAKMLEFGAHPSSDLPDCYIVHGTDIRALRAALERPANDAGAMRHAAAEIARRGAFAAYEEMTDTGHDTEKKHTYSECMDAIGDALSECEAQIRALPLPDPDAVERARREFYEAARVWAEYEVPTDRSRVIGGARRDALVKYDALLAAEASAARDGKGGDRG